MMQGIGGVQHAQLQPLQNQAPQGRSFLSSLGEVSFNALAYTASKALVTIPYVFEKSVSALGYGLGKTIDATSYAVDTLRGEHSVGEVIGDTIGGVGTVVGDTLVGLGPVVKDTAIGVGTVLSDATTHVVVPTLKAVGSQVVVPALTTAVESGGGTLMFLGNSLARGHGLSNLGDLVPREDIMSFTMVGSLPNLPGFDDAIQQKSPELGGTFETVRGQGGDTGTVLTHLSTAIAGKSFERGGTDMGDMTASHHSDFSTALLLGAHFVLEDDGALTDQLSGGNLGFEERSSSHYKGSGEPQFGRDMPGGMGHLLIGKTGEGHTFFQLESHGTGNPQQSLREKAVDVLGHTQAYLQHIGGDSSYVQIGPQGCISASEKDRQHVVIS